MEIIVNPRAVVSQKVCNGFCQTIMKCPRINLLYAYFRVRSASTKLHSQFVGNESSYEYYRRGVKH